MNETNYIKICNVYLNNKIISENIFEVNPNLTDEQIFKFYSLVTSIINIRYGKDKNSFSRTTIDLIKIKNFNLK